MFVTSIRFAAKDDDFARALIPKLTELRHAIGGQKIEGLLDAVLLRGRSSGSMLLSVWADRQAMERFTRSEIGARFSAEVQEVLKGHNAELDEFRATWRLNREP